jgi:hypothetical protein
LGLSLDKLGMTMERNPPVDVKRDRLLAAILFACSVAVLLVPHAWPGALRFTALAAGGFVATLVFPPLLARLRVPAKHAPALGAAAIVLSVFLLFGFIESRVELSIALGLAFVIGMVGFGVISFVDHLRRLA